MLFLSRYIATWRGIIFSFLRSSQRRSFLSIQKWVLTASTNSSYVFILFLIFLFQRRLSVIDNLFILEATLSIVGGVLWSSYYAMIWFRIHSSSRTFGPVLYAMNSHTSCGRMNSLALDFSWRIASLVS